MSLTGGQAFGAVIGAAIAVVMAPLTGGASLAAYLPYAAAGFSIGMAVGGIIDPPPQQTVYQEGSRLGDLNTQTSEWGTPIRRLFGTYRLSGNVIWSLDLNETKHVEESGEGKGGGGTKTETTWYSYSGSWACGFCEGPVSGASKIWFDSVLVFDGTNYFGGLSVDNYTLYEGTPDQPIDWYMQLSNSDTPAYRNLCYIVFRDIQLENYGNKIPKVSVELSESGSNTYSHHSVEVIGSNGTTTPKNGIVNKYRIAHAVLPIGYEAIIEKRTYNTETGDLIDFLNVRSHKSLNPSDKFVQAGNLISDVDAIVYKWGSYFIVDDLEGVYDGIKRATVDSQNLYYYFNGELYTTQLSQDKIYIDFGLPTKRILVDFRNGDGSIYTGGDIGTHIGFNKTHIAILGVTTAPNITYNLFTIDGIYVSSRDMTSDFTTTHYSASQASNRVYLNDLGELYYGCTSASGYHMHKITETTYEYLGTLPLTAGHVYVGPYFGIPMDSAIYEKDGVFYMNTQSGSGGTSLRHSGYFKVGFSDNQVTLSSIVESLFLRAGLPANDFDVSAGNTTMVNGYVVSTPMQTRSAVATLISAYNFELIESNSKIMLKKRDTTSLATIEESEIIDFVEIERMQTVELSRQMNIMYANREKNYDAGIQTTVRNDVDTANTKTYQFPLALSDTEAKRISERFIYSEWNERTEFRFNVSKDYLQLFPSDCITLNYEGRSFLVRITKIDYVTNKSVNIEASLENTVVYDSTAIGSDTGSEVDTVKKVGLTKLKLLDIPMLDNSVNYEGIYIAVNGYYDDWNACAIHKSIDTGATYNKALDVFSEVTMGQTKTALADSTGYVWDYNTVNVFSNDPLYDSNEEEVLNGANYALVGSEVIQYVNATDLGDGIYTLSKLLRGRRGTESAMGSHSNYEDFVLLTNNLEFDRSASLNVESYYTATTFGLFVDTSFPEIITPEIICLKPFSPSYVRGSRDTSNNLTITWMRRSRDVTGYFKTLSLMEEEEKYEIDILDAGDVVLDTKYIQNSQSYVYSNTDQLADNVSHTSGDPIKINIYQISGIVHRGYVTQEVL